MPLNFYDLPWQLNEAACPCDVHFSQYLQENDIRSKIIFHFGTGDHHLVGVSNASRGNANLILAITASKGEYQAYMDLVSSDSQLAMAYKAIYADVYSLNPELLPNFDVVTLFHLGEYWIGSGQGMHGEPTPETPLADEDLLYLFLNKLNKNGILMLYSNSAGWPRIGPIVTAAVGRGDMVKLSEFKTLQIFGSGIGSKRRSWKWFRK
jgi:hypothetical protein